MNLRYSLVLIFVCSLFGAQAQAPFDVHLEPMDIPGLGGLQSFAAGEHDGKWLLIGGRLDGLHRRQPWASFDQAGHNNQLTVVDPVSAEVWTAPLSTLPAPMREQLSSTNIQFAQNADMLYLIGGYGYSATAGDHITYPRLSAVNVPEAMNAIIGGTDPAPHFRYINDELLAVTGGYLHMLNGNYYLVGGHRFDGRYNPMNNPTFSQQYTNALRIFDIEDNGTALSVEMVDSWVDQAAFHRRDYNVAAQIMPDGSEGLTAFSGVFQPTVDLPYLNAVNISADAYAIQPDFSQYFNHYHCAHIPIYDLEQNEMHTLFFGGIAQYYMDGETMVQDDDVPFVKTIARVTRSADGSMAEYKLPLEMPGLLGSGSEFIPETGVAAYSNGVIKLNALGTDSVLVGYIVGGIHSSAPNIFWINDGTQSVAYSTVFKVYLSANGPLGTDQLNPMSTNSLALQVYPNPNEGNLNLRFNLKTVEEIELQLRDSNGGLVHQQMLALDSLKVGENHVEIDLSKLAAGTYLLQLKSAGGLVAVQRVVLRR